MGFNPLAEKGTPIENQFRNWTHLNVQPYSKFEVHPYSRTRGILMNGIEVDAVLFSHMFHHCTDDMELRRKLAMTRRIEQQQQKMVNWLIPGDESTVAVTLGYEQVAVDLTAWLARTEPDPYVKAALDFALLEDFDHLYRYSNLMEEISDQKPESVVGDYTEIFPGRPTYAEHRHPFDDVRKFYDRNSADILTKLHVLTIVAGEQQTMNYYMNVGNRFTERTARGLYQEIAMIEEQHVTHYGSLMDPRETWFERLVLHEYNECYLYHSCLESETDGRVRGMWQQMLDDEIEHLRVACDLMKQYEKRDPQEFLPRELPQATIFQSNKEYVRNILATQVDLTGRDTEFVETNDLPKDYRYFDIQRILNSDDIPSQSVIDAHIRSTGHDYRLETEGPHPVERMRSTEGVVI